MIARPSEVSVDTDCPANGVEDTGNKDSPLSMTEGGIKPERLCRQTDDETPPTPAAEQHCSDRTHEYRGLGGKLEPPSFGGRRCCRDGYVLRPTGKQPTKLQAALPKWVPSHYRLLTCGSRIFLHLPRGARPVGFWLGITHHSLLHTPHRTPRCPKSF